jgi:hypothetical protein
VKTLSEPQRKLARALASVLAQTLSRLDSGRYEVYKNRLRLLEDLRRVATGAESIATVLEALERRGDIDGPVYVPLDGTTAPTMDRKIAKSAPGPLLRLPVDKSDLFAAPALVDGTRHVQQPETAESTRS